MMDNSINGTEALMARIKELEQENAHYKKLLQDAGIACEFEIINKVFETKSDYVQTVPI